ncbi:MAG: hypothetical protein HY683_00545 [Chloroflexi bacterium]|nr:hypothetical protein [Chloroflexota bacterium]
MAFVRQVILWPVGLLRRIRRLPLWLLVPGGLLLVVLLGFGTYRGVSLYQYTQEDPQFCRSCHLMETAWSKWAISEHKEVTCHQCHELSPQAGAELLIRWALVHPQRVEAHAEVPDAKCGACHKSGNPRWKQVAITAGHRVHVADQNIACTECHTPELHRFTPLENVCQQCHEDLEGVQHNVAAQDDCLSCHQYLEKESEEPLEPSLLPTTATCVECHQGSKASRPVLLAGEHKQVQCIECHQPHQTARPVLECTACHSTPFVEGIHTWTGHQKARCTECHQPHEPVVAKGSRCEGCHETPPVLGPLIALNMVEKQACTQCHGPGRVAAIPASHKGRPDESCLLCHQSSQVQPPRIGHSPTGKETCATCHTALPASHQGRTEAQCQLCHEESVSPPKVPHLMVGHSACTTCHAPGKLVGALSPTHVGRSDEKCVICHEPREGGGP